MPATAPSSLMSCDAAGLSQLIAERQGGERNSPVPAANPVTIRFHGAPWRGAPIQFYLICAVGAGIGWLAGLFWGTTGKIVRIEEMLVGVFGAFIGGDFIVSQIVGPTGTGSMVMALGLAAAGACVMLLLLKVMRGVVGPMRNSKPRARQR